MKKIITALQNEKVNEKLSQQENIKIMVNDIQYQEGIIEVLEINSDIDFILISELLPGQMKIEELIEKIKKINEKIKIIIILENKKEELENYLLAKGKIIIFYNNKITIEELINTIQEKTNQEILEEEIKEIKKMINKETNYDKESIKKQEKYFLSERENKKIEKEIEEEFKSKKTIYRLKQLIKKQEKNKIGQIILIMGLRGSGKTIFTINLAHQLKNKKVLIIERNSKNSDIYFLINGKEEIKKMKKNRIKNTNYFIDYENNQKSNEIENRSKQTIVYNKIKITSVNNNTKIFYENTENKSQIEIIKEIKKWKEEYNVILIDIEEEEENNFSMLIEEIDKIIFITEANILQIKKAKKYLEKTMQKYKIEKEKINFVFNKVTSETLSFNVLKKILDNYNILGKVNDIKNCNLLVNHNMKEIYLNKKIKKQYEKIGIEILKDKNIEKYYLNRMQDY